MRFHTEYACFLYRFHRLLHEKARRDGGLREVELLTWLLVVFSVSLAHAQTPSPRENLFDNELLGRAHAEIGAMEMAELRAFTAYLANCDDALKDNDLIVYQCNVARETYEIEYRRGRSLDRLMTALWITEDVIRGDDRIGRKADGQLVVRYADVYSSLRDAANLRFAILRR